jgi:hypothetical protein
MEKFIVYALVDPRTDQIRYIGKSSVGMERPRSHVEPGRIANESNLHKARWLQQLVTDGLRPIIRVLQSGQSDDEILQMERDWIARARAEGWPIVNLTDGGEGTAGCIPSAETRAKMSAAHRGRVFSPETCAKIAAAKRGKPRPDLAERNRTSSPWLGRKQTNETRAKISATLVGNQRNLGRKRTPEECQAIAEGRRRAYAARRAQ